MKQLFWVFVLILLACNDPKEAEAIQFFQRGNFHFQKKEYEKAIYFFNEAILKKEDFTDAYNNRGLTKYRMGNLKDALADFEEALSIEPSYTEALYNRGQIFYDLKDERCLADFEKVAVVFKDSSYVFAALGNAKAFLNDFSGAYSAYSKALQLNPANDKALVDRGTLYYSEKKYKEAKADFEKALQINPTQAYGLNNMSMIMGREANYTQALNFVNKAIEQIPSSAVFKNNKGYFLLMLNQLDEAKAEIESSLRLDDTNGWALRNRGIYYLKTKQTALALADLLNAEKKDPGIDQLYFYIGLAYQANQQKAQACKAFERGQQLGDSEATKMVAIYCK